MDTSNRPGAMRTSPSRWWYALAVLPMIGGLVVMGVIVFTQLSRLGEGLNQIVVPGARELQLEPGRHTVFLEHRSVVDGRVYRVDQVSGLSVEVTSADGGSVPVNAARTYSTYSFGDRHGESISDFDIEQAGRYRISGGYAGGVGPQTVIAVGQGFAATLFTTIAMGLGAVFLGMILSLAVAIGVYVMRRRRRQAFG